MHATVNISPISGIHSPGFRLFPDLSRGKKEK